MTHEHHKRQPAHIRHISERLQNEVDSILSKVDEKTLFAEFREDEVFTIQKGDSQENIVRTVLDERIFMARTNPKYSPRHRFDHGVKHVHKKKVGPISRFFNYLFKPIEY
jgi:hypothetical protein